MSRLVQFCDKYLIDNWRTEWKRLWSIRVVVLWGAVAGLILTLPLISEYVIAITGPWIFGANLVVLSIAFAVARYLKQPGTDNDP